MKLYALILEWELYAYSFKVPIPFHAAGDVGAQIIALILHKRCETSSKYTRLAGAELICIDEDRTVDFSLAASVSTC